MGIKTKKKESAKPYIIVASVIYAILLVYFLHVFALLDPDRGNLLYALRYAPWHLVTHPFKIAFDFSFGIALSLLYWSMFLLIIFRILGKGNRHTAGAEWYTDMKGYNKQYSYPKDADYADEKPSMQNKNMIFGDNLFMSMDTRQTMRNNNVLVVGGSGTGKSRFFVKPNLLQANCSYVCTDPSGELLESTGKFFLEQGYRVKVFNLVEMGSSNHYNPFMYIRDDLGVRMMIECLIRNTTPDGASKGDPFWEKSEIVLLQAICYYLYHLCPKSEQNFTNVMRLIRLAKVSEEDENMESTLDKMFANLEKQDPNHIAVKNYHTFKVGAGKTLKSILISVLTRLSAFDLTTVQNLTNDDDIDLGSVGDRPTVLFVVLPSADATFNFLAALMYSQMFESLYYHAENEIFCIENDKKDALAFFKSQKAADEFIANMSSSRIIPTRGEDSYTLVNKINKPVKKGTKADLELYQKQCSNLSVAKTGKRLRYHVRFMLDEFANIGQIPDFDKKLATMRKYEISCSIILQNEAQLKAQYDKAAPTIKGNCDTFVFLGSPEIDTLKGLNELLGKEATTKVGTSHTHGTKGSGNTSINQETYDLADITELRTMDNRYCVVIIRALSPFYVKKYDYPRHPNYKYTGDADKKNGVTSMDIVDANSKDREVIGTPTPVVSRDNIQQTHDENTAKAIADRMRRQKRERIESAVEKRNSSGQVYMQPEALTEKTMQLENASKEQIQERFTVEEGFVPDHEFQIDETAIRTLADKHVAALSTTQLPPPVEEEPEDILEDYSEYTDALVEAMEMDEEESEDFGDATPQ